MPQSMWGEVYLCTLNQTSSKEYGKTLNQESLSVELGKGYREVIGIRETSSKHIYPIQNLGYV